MATGLSPKPRGGCTSSTRLPARRAASTSSPRGSRLRSTYSSPGGGPQVASMASRSSAGSAAVPAEVVGGGDADGGAGQLPVGQPLGVLAAGGDQGVDQGVAVGRLDAGERVVAGGGAEVVAVLAQRPEEADGAGRGVEADGVADPGVLGRVRRQHHRHPPVGRGDVPQPGQGDGGAGHPAGPLGVGDVPRQAVAVELLERERDADQPAVELGDGHLGGRVQRAQAGGGGGPLGPRRGQAQRLDDRDVEGGDGAGVPGLVVAAGLRQRRGRPAGGEHRHHQRVGPARAPPAGRGRPLAGWRTRPAGPGPRGPRRPRRGRRRTRCCRPARGPGSRGRRPSARRSPAAPHPHAGVARGREAVAGEQDRVGQEVGSSARLAGPPWARYGGPGRRCRRGRGQRHQGRVGGLLAAEDDQRRGWRRNRPVPRARPARRRAGGRRPGRRRPAGPAGPPAAAGPGWPAGSRPGWPWPQQVGVGGRQQQDAGTVCGTAPPRGPRPGSSVTPAESPGSRIVARPGLPARTGRAPGSLPGDSGGTAPDSHRLPPWPSGSCGLSSTRPRTSTAGRRDRRRGAGTGLRGRAVPGPDERDACRTDCTRPRRPWPACGCRAATSPPRACAPSPGWPAARGRPGRPHLARRTSSSAGCRAGDAGAPEPAGRRGRAAALAGPRPGPQHRRRPLAGLARSSRELPAAGRRPRPRRCWPTRPWPRCRDGSCSRSTTAAAAPASATCDVGLRRRGDGVDLVLAGRARPASHAVAGLAAGAAALALAAARAFLDQRQACPDAARVAEPGRRRGGGRRRGRRPNGRVRWPTPSPGCPSGRSPAPRGRRGRGPAGAAGRGPPGPRRRAAAPGEVARLAAAGRVVVPLAGPAEAARGPPGRRRPAGGRRPPAGRGHRLQRDGL